MTQMDSIDVPRVLSILGAVAEAATTDELLGAVLEASVALVHPDTAVATEVSTVDMQDSTVDRRDNAADIEDDAWDMQDAGDIRDSAVVTRDSTQVPTRVKTGNAMVNAVGPAGPRIKTWPEDLLSFSQQLAFDQLSAKGTAAPCHPGPTRR